MHRARYARTKYLSILDSPFSSQFNIGFSLLIGAKLIENKIETLTQQQNDVVQ